MARCTGYELARRATIFVTQRQTLGLFAHADPHDWSPGQTDAVRKALLIRLVGLGDGLLRGGTAGSRWDFGAALGALVTERAWELPAVGATLRDRWAAIAPELAGHVAAVAYDADSGRLTVCPESAAWATKVPAQAR
ncbi:DciA family protein [Streptomyces sp. NPDC015144]|uniref:DciA family protein n=1 Tax=Streptomyces sp. NPDC015144 TaxID=3364944 RepID=UPI003701CB11